MEGYEMEIMVQGMAKKLYKPDQVSIKIDFYTNAENYEEALTKGVKDVEIFIKEVLEKLGFSKEDMKTNSFSVAEEKRFDYETKKEIKLGFSYRQSALVKFDYSMEKVANFIEKITELINAPKCKISFGIRDIEKVKNELLAQAYKKAREKAEVIANAAEKSLKDCLKTDFKPFEESYFSSSNINGSNFGMETAKYRMGDNAIKATNEIIMNTFTPEDIEISESIYCLWIAE